MKNEKYIRFWKKYNHSSNYTISYAPPLMMFRRNHGQLSTLNSPLEDNLINCIIANQISRYRKLITSTTTRLLIQSNTVDDKTRPRPKQNDIIVRWKIESGVINDIGLRRSNSLPPQGSQEGGNWKIEKDGGWSYFRKP